MLLYLVFLLIIRATIAKYNRAWEIGEEYQYHIESRTLTALDKLDGQFSGILMRGDLTLQVTSRYTMLAVVSETQYASVNKVLPGVWDEITDLKFKELSLSGKPFEITINNGVIRDMLVDQDVPTWEMNLLKSFVSQLQIDTMGENIIEYGRTEAPDENPIFAPFTVMEDSVGGKCEVRYRVTPINEENFSVPVPYLHDDERYFRITKEKNYSRCEQGMAHHSRLVGKIIWKPGDNDELVSRSSTTHVIISGHLRWFTIQSIIMTNKISVDSKTEDTYSGAVYSSVNITLVRKSQISNPIAVSNDLVSTGNLVYNYKNPLSNQRTPRPSVNESSLVAQSAERNSSDSSRVENRSDGDSRFSSNSTTEERDYLQTKPKLDEAPEDPLLPYVIGYKDLSIQNSYYASEAVRRIDGISWQILNIHVTSILPFVDTLEQFTFLISLLRTMNVGLIAEVENELSKLTNDLSNFSSEKDQKLYKQTVWDIFCYSVAYAGTGPALITIKNWIRNGKMEGIQAAQILSIIPKTALTPTTEYVAAFFELITDEQVTNQKFLNTTAPLSFAELTSYTRSHNTSPYLVHTFDRVASKDEDALLETYIPYMATQLREAVESGDSRRIQTYIMALGNFGHPKILSVFEPYLNATISVSKFQRLMMVVSLNKLSEKIPGVVRNVAYKIYMNVTEAYELRCAAVYIIMKTKPPLDVLQRMAEFTNQDQDQQVNSAVKSNIENLAKMKQPEWEDIADEARTASKLLKPDIKERNSQGIFQESKYASVNLAQTIILQAIGGDDIGIPKLAYMGSHQSYGNFNLPPSRIMYTLSNIRDWINMWYQVLVPEKVNKKNILLNIIEEIEKFGIMPLDTEPLEGNVFMDSVFALEFYPFDNHTIKEFVNMLKDYAMSLSQTPKHIFESRNINHFYHYDITLGFPTETGLSFVYTLTIPKFTMICGGGSYEIVKSEPGEFKNVTAVGYVASSEKIRNRIGFVTPFEHKHYIAGVDINTQFFIPAGLSLKWNKTRRFELKVFPNENSTRYRDVVIHHSVAPYTAIQDILEPQSEYLGNKGRLVYAQEPQVLEFSKGNLWLSAKSDQITSKPLRTQTEAYSEIYKAFFKGGAHYRTFDSILHLTTTLVNITFDSDIALKNESSEATIPAVIDKRPNNEARALQFLQEVGKEMNSPIGHIFDMSIFYNDSNYVFTLAMADSYIDDKSQAFLYWNIQSPDDENVFSEFCALGYTRSSRIPLNFDEAIEKIPNNEFKAELRFGSCADGDPIILKGNWTRTNDVMQVLATKSEIVDKCRQEMRQGNIWLRSCQRASELIQQKDLLTMSMHTNSDVIYAIDYSMLHSIKMMVPNTNMTILNSRSINNNTIDMEIKLPHGNNDATISLRIAATDVSFSLTDIFDDVSDFKLNKYLEQFFFSGVPEEPACVVDKTQVVTFDDKSYPLKLGKCRHVIMTTYSKRDPSNPQKILNNLRDLIVMAREMDDGSITVLIVFDVGSLVHDIYLRKLNDSDHLQATVNSRVVNLPYYESYLYYWDREIVSIYQLDGMIIVHLKRYEFYAVYDGERIKLHASDKYRNSVRGLCGNYDMQSNNDFVTPSNCVLTKPEEFAAMYALTQDACEGPALQNKRKAEQSTCFPISNIPADLISEREA